MENLDKEANIDTCNPEFQKALQIINYTNRSLFLTGKAGTGKSTFLRYICQHTKKKHVVLAPTGIAAINAEGVTLHSFFKLPFHPLIPTDSRFSMRNIKETLKYNGEKRKIIRELELLIIDEISMVRADIIDFVDKVLRIYSRNMRQPFGGKQLLLVGDVYQLEPVAKEEDNLFLRPFYQSVYFFDASVFRNFQLISIELRKVYRQSDPEFIHILDHIRTNNLSTGDLLKLNSRVGELSEKHDNAMSITLSTRRDTVDFINERELKILPGMASKFEGRITGDFPVGSLPTPMSLELKVGAQVIFIKNDLDKRWVNGTLGVIEAMDVDNKILYVITDDGKEFEVEPTIWSNLRYKYNEEEQKIEEEEIGTYTQFPLRLAWAITVHKSQGLTFRRVNIDFTGGVFAGGQTYVALSRCTSLEGITLKEPIRRSDVFVKSEVLQFSQTYNNNVVINKALSESKADIEYRDSVEAFDRGDMEACLDNFFKAIHSRYDIEKPLPRRFMRKKLNIVNILRNENKMLKDKLNEQTDFLKKLAVEYVVLGKECEAENMVKAAIANYEKALKLCPNIPEAMRRLKKINKK